MPSGRRSPFFALTQSEKAAGYTLIPGISGYSNVIYSKRRELTAPGALDRYMIMHFLGQASAQVPQATHFSSSSFHVFAARSTSIAPAGHFFAQSVQ